MTIFNKSYIAHARHIGPAPENTIALYIYLINVLKYDIIEGDVVFTLDGIPVLNHGTILSAYKNGEQIRVDISAITYDELLNYSLLQNTYLPISTVEDFVSVGFQHNVSVMLDLTFQKYTMTNYRSLYSIVKKYRMTEKTIWGDPDIIKLVRLDRNLICQVGGSWGRKLLVEAFVKSFFCKKMIMSYSYYGGNIEQFEKLVLWGHKLGFIMKAATINDKEVADRFWAIGTDLINTDTLTN